MAELAHAYVALLPSLRGAGKEVDKGLNSPEVQRAADKAGENTGKRMGGGLKTTLLAGAVAAAALAGAAIAKGVGDALEREKLSDKTAASLGLTEKQSAKAGSVAGKLYAGAWGENMPAVTDAVESVISSIDGMATASPKRLHDVTASVLDIATAFDIDASSAATNVGILIKNGLAKDAEEGVDLITASLQRVPKALRGEVTDATQEYSQFFADLGYTGSEAMGLLVSATEDGQYGVDKMGDAIKEFTIRGTDMSKATKGAYETLKLNSRDTTNELLAGGDRAKQAFQTIIGGIKGIKDPAKQAETAIALFGTPLEDLGTTEIPKFLDGLTGTKTSLGDVSGAAAAMGTTLNDNLGTMLESAKRRAEVFVTDGLLAIYEGFKSGETSGSGFIGVMSLVGSTVRSATDWLEENKATVQLVAAVVGGMAGAWLVMNAAVIATRLPMMLATAAQWAMNAALAANPIGLVVIAIGALVGALVWLYQNNETVRKVIDAAWAGIQTAISATVGWITNTAWPALQTAWTAIGDGMSWLYENIISPVWNGIKTAIQVAWNVIRIIFVTWATVFSLLWQGISFVWSKTGAPLFAAIQAVATAVWNWLRDKVFAPIGLAFRLMVLGMQIVKVRVLDPMWAGIRAVASAAWNWLKNNVFAPIGAGFRALGEAFRWVKQNVIDPVWSGLRSAASAAWAWIRDKAFGPLKKGVDAIGTVFEATKKIISAAWDGIKAAAAKPINFIIETVYTQGIKKTWDKIADSVGLDLKLPTVKPIAYANGGVENHTAQIAHAGAMRLWAEPETGGEAYIPLASSKRGRSTSILADVAGRFGYGLTQFADGGIVGDAVDAGRGLLDILMNPAKVFGAFTRGLDSLGGGVFGKVAGAIPKKIIDALVEKIGFGGSSGAGFTGSKGIQGMTSATMGNLVRAMIPGTTITSGYRPGSRVAGYGTLSYHARNRAVDIVGGPGLSAIFDILNARLGASLTELLYSPKGASQILAKGVRGNTSGVTRANHFDHVHMAMLNGGILPKVYDQGGWMNPGDIGMNRGPKPEAVLTPDESRALKSGLGQRAPRNLIFNTTRVSPRDVLHALDIADLQDVGVTA
jgi:phage-related minor tail protein